MCSCPVPGVREDGRRNLLLFQNVLSRRQKTGQGLWRDGDVFDEGNRPLGTFQPVKRRDYASCQFPKAISLIGFQSDVVIERFLVTSLDLLNEIFQLFVQIDVILILKFNQQHALCVRRDHAGVLGVFFPGNR